MPQQQRTIHKTFILSDVDVEPIIPTIIAALVAGSVAAAQDVASEAIKDAYSGLKALVLRCCGAAKDPVEAIEQDPQDEAEQKVLAKRLSKPEVSLTPEIVTAAQELLDRVDELRTQPAARALFDFDRLRVARNLKIADVESLGAIFIGRDVEVQGDLTIEKIRQSPAQKKT
jgi:hypothetical protein